MEEISEGRCPVPDAVVPERWGQSSVRGMLSLPMMSVYIPMMIASSLATAGSIGLFEKLADGPMDLHGLASTLDMSEEGLGRLTDFLVAAGHLRRSGPAIANTSETTRWFTSRGDVDYGSGLAWTADAWRIMEDLPAAVTSGGPKQLLWERMSADPELGTHFSRYMRAFAEHLSPDLITSVTLPEGAGRLLDLGGSHGKHSMEFCRVYPELHAVIVDQSSALNQTEAEIGAAGLSDRTSIRPGDIRDCDWGHGYDVVLYLSIAHNMTLDENRSILNHLATVMRPGGRLIIHDYPRDTTPALFETAFRLTLLVETGTRTFTYAEFSDVLSEAGFSRIELKTLSPAEKGALIIARR
jgi:SAM-dependent methyltransferase